MDEGHGGHSVGCVMMRAMEAIVLPSPWWTLHWLVLGGCCIGWSLVDVDREMMY